MDKRDRIYPGCCSSGQCAGGGDDCKTCPYREHKEDFDKWRSERKAIRPSVTWSPTVWRATVDENGIPYEEEK